MSALLPHLIIYLCWKTSFIILSCLTYIHNRIFILHPDLVLSFYIILQLLLPIQTVLIQQKFFLSIVTLSLSSAQYLGLPGFEWNCRWWWLL